MRNLSSCSCKKGSLFCSYCIGFLYIVSVIQNMVVTSEEVFESAYRVSPQLLAAVPMLIENYAADGFNRSVSQRKQQRKSRDSADGTDTNEEL